MRRLAAVLLASLSLAACATSDTGSDVGPGGGGGGKSDDASACPVEGDGDAIIAAIEGAGSCYSAAGIAESCAYGSGLDVQFVAAATAICGRGFEQMTADAKTTYEGLLERCAAKYAEQSGSMYRSLTAFCQLEVTRLYNTFYPEPETGEDAVSYSPPECPVEASDADAIETAISEASSCGTAADIAGACAFGSGIDVSFVAAATEKCAAPPAADTALFEQLGAACDELYAGEEGSMYRSMTAFCHLEVAELFDSLNAEVE